nr:unnamed protein product [Callosobruchus chinensis]
MFLQNVVIQRLFRFERRNAMSAGIPFPENFRMVGQMFAKVGLQGGLVRAILARVQLAGNRRYEIRMLSEHVIVHRLLTREHHVAMFARVHLLRAYSGVLRHMVGKMVSVGGFKLAMNAFVHLAGNRRHEIRMLLYDMLAERSHRPEKRVTAHATQKAKVRVGMQQFVLFEEHLEHSWTLLVTVDAKLGWLWTMWLKRDDLVLNLALQCVQVSKAVSECIHLLCLVR